MSIRKCRVLIAGSVPSLFSERKDSFFYCNATKDSKPGLSLRKFPLDRPELLTKWLLAINVENFVPTSESLICSEHFNRSCFQEIKNRKSFNLRVDAVPSIFFKGPREEPTEEPAVENIEDPVAQPDEELGIGLSKPISETESSFGYEA